MHLSKLNSLHKICGNLCIIICMILFIGCGDKDNNKTNIDTTIPENNSWTINTILNLENSAPLSPMIEFHQENGRLHMAWFDAETVNPGLPEEDVQYSVKYKAFNMGDLLSLNSANTIEETVSTTDISARSLEGLAVAVSNGTPLVAYSVYKDLVPMSEFDLNNQGDIILGVRDGGPEWRKEIFAFGDVERNAVFVDGLVKNSMSLKGDADGNARLCFQFFYEGIDSYNYEYPDLRYIEQPLDNISGVFNTAASLEETVEGNDYGTGEQNYQGAYCDLQVDNDGNPVAFHYADFTVQGSQQDKGLRVARRIDGEWQQAEWIDYDTVVTNISGAVKSNGLLAVAYTVKDGPYLFIDQEDDDNPMFSLLTIPYSVRYAEQFEVITETVNSDGEIEEVITYDWKTHTVNLNTIAGEYCSLDIDSLDNPVIAYFDDMNYNQTRFFCRIKISRRNNGGVWDVDTIIPEDVGLTNETSPYGIDPGTHDKYYIGKFNYLWIDSSDRVNICSYSNVTKKVYLFVEN